MGWKCNSVLLRPATLDIGADLLLGDLGYEGLSPLGEAPYEQAIWPLKETIWIAEINGCLILSGRGLADEFFGARRPPLVDRLFARHPKAEIGAVTLHSVVNLWGFAVYREGREIRSKAGSSDDGTFRDFGAPLGEEAEQLACSRLEGGERVYRLPEFPGEDLSEDQVGEDYVFKIFQRFTGLRPDRDEELLTLKCAGFRLAPKPIWRRFFN